MFIRLSIAASILVIIVSYANAQYYQIKWKFPGAYGSGLINNSFYTVPNYNPFDMDNDGVSEIVTYDHRDTNYVGAIYDGATYKIKYHIRSQYNYNGRKYSPLVSHGYVYGFYDIDGDHVKELICAGRDADSFDISGYLFINPFTDQVEFFYEDQVYTYPLGFSDIDNDGFIEMITPHAVIGHSATPVVQPQILSKKAELVSKIYPNPIVNSARIEYYVPSVAHVKIGIFDISGKLIRTLVNANKNAGEFTEIWDGKSDNNKGLAPGQYYYNIQIGDFVTNKKVILLQ